MTFPFGCDIIDTSKRKERKRKMKTIFVISKENHGNVVHAATRQRAIQALIDTAWIAGYCELWDFKKQVSTPIDLLHPNWKEWLLNSATDEDFENMGYGICEVNFFE